VAIEYFSFEKVLKELQMDEDELKRLVSEGQIRAFRDEDRMKFRKDDIEGLKKGRQTEPTIILPPGGGDAEGDDIMLVDDDTDETLLDLDDLADDDLGEADETAIPSLDLDDDDDASSDTLTEELVFDEDLDEGETTDEVATQETLIDDDDDEIGMTTEPLDLDDEDEEDEKPKTVVARPRAATVRASARSSGRAMAPAVEEVEDVTPGMVACTIIAAVILFLAGLFIFDIVREKFNPISGKIASIFQKSFSGDGDPKWFTDRDKKIEEGEEDMGDMDDEEGEGEGEEEEGGGEEEE
jgi:hypothetical protein